MILITIIIPIYNQEKYLERCLNSILKSLNAQTKRLIEIICIDDGSTDSSLKILANYSEDVKIYERTNNGLGATRNFGIEVAKGKYLMFIDSDDSINSKNFTKLINSMSNRHEDCIDFSSSVIKMNIKHHDYHQVYTEKQSLCLEEYVEGKSRLLITAWSRLWKRELVLLNNIRFQEGVKFEDVKFAKKFYQVSSSYYEIPLEIYFYYIHPLSITNNKVLDFKTLNDLVNVRLNNLNNWLQSSIDNDSVLRLLKREILDCGKKLVKLMILAIRSRRLSFKSLKQFLKGYYLLSKGLLS